MEAQSQETIDTAPRKRKLNKRFLIVFLIMVVVGGIFGIRAYLHGQKHEETEDAQIDGNISPVIPRISGYISEVRVSDNQLVRQGDTLLVLDDRDLQLRLEQAQAALQAARSNLGVAAATTTASQASAAATYANIATIDAQIEAAKVNLWRATQDYNRYANLVKDHSITQQQYEQALAAKETAERQVRVLQEQRNAASRQAGAAGSQTGVTTQQVSVANASIRQHEVDVENAQLNLSYAVITAPTDGRVSKVPVRAGQFVQAGQNLFSIVPDEVVWVTANFKETQLSKMQVGQPVTIQVDALPGIAFNGKVASFSPATSARFSVLPADNASGNFVKVVQRVPVRIEFSNPRDPNLKKVRPGMNVVVDVHVGQKAAASSKSK